MASVRVYLDTRKERKDKTYPLKLNVSHRGSFQVNLKVYLEKEQWEAGKVVNHPQKRFLNMIVKQKLSEVENLILSLTTSGELRGMNKADLKKAIENHNSDQPEEVEPEPGEYLFRDHFEKFLAEKIKESTREKYEATLTRVKEYTDIETLSFSKMNLAWLKGFERYLMTTTPSVNGRGVHLRNIRAIFNDAINHDLVPLSAYPFRKFKIKKQVTAKRSLTPEQIAEIRDTHWPEKEQVAADAFMLMFYLIGINTVDLLALSGITHEGRIEYHREKTGRFYSIEVLPEAMALIEKYPGEKRLLRWGEHYKQYRSFTKMIDKRLKTIGETIKAPALSSYYARHSWATIAAGLDISKETIAASLGHGGNTVTDIYIDFERKKVDEANRKVLDFIADVKREE